jgi:hypothetical protein
VPPHKIALPLAIDLSKVDRTLWLSIKPPLCGVNKLTFFSHPFMRLGGTFDPVMELASFGRQKFRDLINTARTGADQP